MIDNYQREREQITPGGFYETVRSNQVVDELQN